MASQKAEIEIVLSNGAKAGDTLKELRKTANQLNREVSNLKPGTEEFIKKSADLQKVNGRMGEIRNQIKGTTEASNSLKDAFSRFVPFSGQFQKIGENLGFVTKGVGGLSRGFGVLRGAIISTGIGALVLILGSLIAYLTSTQEGMDKLNKVIRPLQAIFQRLIGVAQELGEKVFKRLQAAIEDPKQAFIDLGNAIKENIINRFEALALFGPAIAKIFTGDLSGGFKDLGNASVQLATGVENAIDKIQDAADETKRWIDESIDAGSHLDSLQKKIELAEINLTRQRAILNEHYQKGKEIAQDVTRSEEERLAAAQAAQSAQNKLLDMEQNFLDLKIEKMKLEHTLNDTSRADELELAKLEAERTEFSATAAKKRASARALENAISEQASKKAEEAAKRELEVRQQIEDFRVEAMQEGIEKEIAQIEQDTERKIEALTGSEEQITEQRILLEEIKQQKVQAVRDKFAEEALKAEKKHIDEQKKIAEEKAAFDRQLEEESRALAKDSFAFAAEITGRLLKSEQDAKIARKSFAVLEVSINLQKELSANAVAAAANPLNATTFGAAGAAQLARANFSSIARAVIASAKILAFKKGGVLRGPSHAGGGIPMLGRGGVVYGEAEGDEIVLTKGVYRNPALRRAASIINELGGGRSFQSGGPIAPSSIDRSRSPIPSAQSSSDSIRQVEINNDSAAELSQLRDAFLIYANRIDNWVNTLKVENVVTETEDAIKTVNKIRDVADV